MYKCKWCGFKTAGKLTLRDHIYNNHRSRFSSDEFHDPTLDILTSSMFINVDLSNDSPSDSGSSGDGDSFGGGGGDFGGGGSSGDFGGGEE